jgi:CheY-like chemotaxis protein
MPQMEKRHTILLVDDSISSELVIPSMVRELIPGHELATPGIRFAKDYLLKKGVYQSANTPNLILVDLHMGANAGFLLLRWLAGQPQLRNISRLGFCYSWIAKNPAIKHCQPDEVLIISNTFEEAKAELKSVLKNYLKAAP